MDIKKLESWYQNHHRKLPFRENHHPYFIWVSEIMLQQTQVETVLPFFKAFIEKYPTVMDLAQTSLDELKKTVEGLGYYRRFQLMHQAAKQISDKFKGEFPKTYQDIIALPGIGSYTAGALMSICYNEPYNAIDGNVIRVLSRFYNITGDMRLEKNKKILDKYSQNLIHQANPRIYTQAMMELGALICRPKQPKCNLCPISLECQANLLNKQNELPILSKLKDKKELHYIVLIIKENDGVYLRKRTESLLQGMYEYPQYESESVMHVISALENDGIYLEVIHQDKSVKHIFTHQIWHMDIILVKRLKGYANDWVFTPNAKLSLIPMAVAHRKIKI